jgi:hypothetical protein
MAGTQEYHVATRLSKTSFWWIIKIMKVIFLYLQLVLLQQRKMFQPEEAAPPYLPPVSGNCKNVQSYGKE